MMKKWFYSLVAVPFLLAACGDDPEVETLDTAEVPAIVEVDIQTAEQLNVGKRYSYRHVLLKKKKR